MKQCFFVILCTCIGITALAQEVQRVYLAPIKLINVHADYAESVASLFKTYGETSGKYEFILSHPSDDVGANSTMDQLYAAAKKKNAPLLDMGELNRIGEIVVVTFSLYDTEKCDKIWGDRMQAATPDDLLPVITRMASSIGSEKQASQDDDIYNVTEGESQQLRTVKSFTSFGVSIGGGPLLSHSQEIDNSSPSGFGLRISNDARQVIIDVTADFLISDYNSYMIGLDVIKPLQTKSNSPYINGGMSFGGGSMNLAPGVAAAGDLQNTGLTLQGGAGYLLNRRASIRVFLGARAYASLYKINNKNPIGMAFYATVAFN